ncbi:aromatic ring-opening dioxygenase LigA [Cellulomonas oligotrophica]|uniref:Aromatic ring-opening dioxygenase LigA n=1 Tax=Cellulomonas oligotrophica TaxID=931536 RepID=A0A7Y9FE09_9CELL|nr:aromatic ring-opening dioxygenase LigA [Cellulomonas oligotrophica]NYD85423.1 hypothetical protein [Cellulomonas oligotrophica]GIG31568.1 hypothetical protein Col01nite_07270 [Cellulomonas oligotrophica]
MSNAVSKSQHIKILAIVVMVFGAIFAVAGTGTWIAVSSNLAAEKIVVAEDAAAFAGATVDTPWEAWAQADIINHHALEASGGLTYSELDREDPVRETMMNGSFLRASLFTSVVAFGVALLVFGLGVVFIIVGETLRRVAAKVETSAAAPELAKV